MDEELKRILTVISISELTEALRKTLGKRGIPEDEISKLADYLMSFFGFNDEVIDNLLRPEDRDVFYMLEEEGLLTTRREEINLKRGKLWRIHYWIIKKEHIKALAASEEEEEEEGIGSVYDSISEEVWSRD
ncbi:MAG: hypothetical protein KAS60_07515 [Thermoplasmata archaeon]|nr:hypothetical protein [Candidatus Thermoplasmatota archaeon]MCK4949918.1 hypothetical protein [Thermoplasmata archaeon]